MKAAFFAAVKTGDLDALGIALAAQPPLANARTDDGTSAALLAAYYGQDEVVRALVAAGAELSFHEACAVGEVAKMAAFIEADPAVANARSPDGYLPLSLTAAFGRLDACKLLLQGGADVEGVSQTGLLRPIHSALFGRSRQIIEMLLDAGADVNSAQESAFTPLHAAAQNGDASVVDLLLSRGADKAAKSAEGKTARDYAEDARHGEVAAMLSLA